VNGWIKLHRVFREWEWYDQSNCVAVFIDLLLHANHEDGKYRGIEIPMGSMTTSQGKIAERTGLTVRQVRTVLDRLSLSGEVTVKTNNKFSMISITNWEKYQCDDRQNASRESVKCQSDVSLMSTSKNLRNKEIKNTVIENPGLFEVEPLQIETESPEELPVKILTALNAICFRNFRYNKFNAKLINARLKEGFVYEDFLAVIKHMQRIWGNDPKMGTYLQPSTLFSGKMDQYLNQAKNADKPKIDPLEAFFREQGFEPQRMA
jgi:uncharacterized phage protein (TIGR02220 family)